MGTRSPAKRTFSGKRQTPRTRVSGVRGVSACQKRIETRSMKICGFSWKEKRAAEICGFSGRFPDGRNCFSCACAPEKTERDVHAAALDCEGPAHRLFRKSETPRTRFAAFGGIHRSGLGDLAKIALELRAFCASRPAADFCRQGLTGRSKKATLKFERIPRREFPGCATGKAEKVLRKERAGEC